MSKSLRFKCNFILALLIFVFFQISNSASASTSCSFSMQSLDFGTIRTTSGPNFENTTFGSLSASCNSDERGKIYICTANMGSMFSMSPLVMSSGDLSITFKTSDLAGNDIGPGMPPNTFEFPFGNGLTTHSFTILGTVTQDPTTIAPGSYFASFTGSNTAITYAVATNDEDRNTACASAVWETADYTASGNVVPSCSIATTPLVFPSIGFDTNGSTGNFDVTANCSYGTAYQVFLEPFFSPDPSGMHILRSDEFYDKIIYYELYQTTNCNRKWGDRASGTGFVNVSQGTPYVIKGCGRILPQIYPAPGQYSGLINVVIVY